MFVAVILILVNKLTAAAIISPNLPKIYNGISNSGSIAKKFSENSNDGNFSKNLEKGKILKFFISTKVLVQELRLGRAILNNKYVL